MSWNGLLFSLKLPYLFFEFFCILLAKVTLSHWGRWVSSAPRCASTAHGGRCICQREISGSRRQRWRGLRQPLVITSFTCHSPPTFSLSMAACPPAMTALATASPKLEQRTSEATCMWTWGRLHTNAQTKCDTTDCICCCRKWRPVGDEDLSPWLMTRNDTPNSCNPIRIFFSLMFIFFMLISLL